MTPRKKPGSFVYRQEARGLKMHNFWIEFILCFIQKLKLHTFQNHFLNLLKLCQSLYFAACKGGPHEN